MDKFREMQAFAAVVASGSFVKAAEALNTSKTAVSRYINDLEARLHVRLLQRTTRRLSLTVEGQAFLERCKDVLAAIDDAESEVTETTTQPAGLLRVNAPVTFGILHLAPLWGGFGKQNPKIELDISLSDRVVDLVEEGYDLAIRIASLPSSTLISRKLASTRMVLCASPQYLKERGHPESIAELASHSVISYSYWATRDEWTFSGPHGAESVKTRPRIHANNGDTCRHAALANQGIILQPTFLVGEDLKSGALMELLPQYRSVELGVYAVYASRRHLPKKVRNLIEFLANAFAQPAWL